MGIVAAVSGVLAEHDGFILDSQQYADLETGRFFMRVAFKPAGPRFPSGIDAVREAFSDTAKRFGLDWTLVDSAARLRILVAVSQASHCLNDLLHRWSTGALPVDIAGVVSNHETCRGLAEWHKVRFYYLPISPEDREAQEQRLAALITEAKTDLLVLARYMQILSPGLVEQLEGRCINIHHSFLPSFKGANPYHRAHARGVKLIGATAHYVTAELDEGPIIEQSVERVDHRASTEDMVRIGRDIEAQVLARAVGWAAEHRILRNGGRTVVFR